METFPNAPFPIARMILKSARSMGRVGSLRSVSSFEQRVPILMEGRSSGAGACGCWF